MDDNESIKPEKAAAPKKKGLPTMVLMLGAIVATGASAAAGAVLGPALAASKAQAAASASASASAHAEEAEAAPGEAAALDPIVVDVREASGELHHLKVGIAIELGHGVTEEQFKRLVPRMRDAAISYLRSLPFDQVTTPSKFDPIRAELGERISHAAGKDKVKRVLFTDFVAQ